MHVAGLIEGIIIYYPVRDATALGGSDYDG